MKIDQSVLSVLDAATIDGNSLVLSGQLDRKLYQSVAKVIEAAGGKWNRKAGAHVFDGPAAEAIEPVILTGEVTNRKADFGQFYTPDQIARDVIARANIEPGMSLLEPSAGRGAIAIPARAAGASVRCIDIDAKNCLALTVAGFSSVRNVDFLEETTADKFDRVVMNPPFARQADIDHVLHAARNFLAPGGRLVAIMSSGVKFRMNRKTEDFRAFVAFRSGTIDDLPTCAFRESGTDVSTVMVTIDG